MKKSLLYLAVLITILTSTIFPFQWEMGIRYTDGTGSPISGKWVYLYKLEEGINFYSE